MPAVLAPEVQRIDVLILFWRILGVRNRAVRALMKPIRVLLDPRVIGRALEREVEGDLHLSRARRRDQAVEVLEGAELRLDRVVAALLVADRPRTARVIRLGRECVVLALAEAVPHRMN